MLGYGTVSLIKVSDYNIRTRSIFAGQSGASKFSVPRYIEINRQGATFVRKIFVLIIIDKIRFSTTRRARDRR